MMERSSQAQPFVIVGGGLAGGVAARTLREEGYDGRLLLISNEPGLPFGRPPLSKTYLRGEEGLAKWLVEPADWYERNQVEIVHARATRLDAGAHRLELDTRGALDYWGVLRC